LAPSDQSCQFLQADHFDSIRFRIALFARICTCGCGAKIRTPLGPTEWAVEETAGGPTLTPSVGNWQQPCQSHYWIHEGEIRWAAKWTPAQIAAGRRREQERRRQYYDALYRERSLLVRFWRWLKGLFGA